MFDNSLGLNKCFLNRDHKRTKECCMFCGRKNSHSTYGLDCLDLKQIFKDIYLQNNFLIVHYSHAKS